MLRKIISEKKTIEKHICACDSLVVKRMDNPNEFEAVLYIRGAFRIPLEDKKYISDVENLLQKIVCNLDDSIKNIYKED